jgi:hypothetical protein
MARIRTIKPEFWDSADTARATLRARLLYIAMWNLADDYGIGDGNHKRIIGFAFPNDEIGVSEIPRLIAEVSRTFSVMFYEYQGRPYYYIPSWENHQRTEKRAKQRVPFPDPAKTPESSGETDGVGKSAESLGNPGAGTGEQGNRGTGERELGNTCPTPPDDFDAWYAAYPRKESKGPARTAFVKAKKKAGTAALVTGAERYRDDPNREDQFTKLPATWLNAECWDDGPLPPRGQQPTMRPTGSQVRLQAGFELMQRAQAKQEQQQQILEIEG